MNPQFIQKQIQLNNCTISYKESSLDNGDSFSDSTPILFLHGWGISSEPYLEVLTFLAQQHPIIAPDLPSFARSHYPHLVETYQDYAEFLLEFLAAINIQKVHVIGHSLGGGIALTLAALAPDKIASLVPVNATGIPSGSVPEVLLRRLVEMPLQISLPKLKLQLVDIPQAFLPNLVFNTQNVIQGLLLSLERDLRSLLPQIKSPCLLLWSKKDFTTPLANAEEFAAKIPHAKLVAVEEGYHEWVLLYPEKFTAIVNNFLDSVNSPTYSAVL